MLSLRQQAFRRSSTRLCCSAAAAEEVQASGQDALRKPPSQGRFPRLRGRPGTHQRAGPGFPLRNARPDHCCLFMASKVQPDSASGCPLSLPLVLYLSGNCSPSSSALQPSVLFIRRTFPCCLVLNRWCAQAVSEPASTGNSRLLLRTAANPASQQKRKKVEGHESETTKAERGSAGPRRAALRGHDGWPLFPAQPHHLLRGNLDGCMCNDCICLTVYSVGEPLYTSPPASMFSVDLLVTMDRLVHSRRPGRSLKATLQSKPAKSVALVRVWEREMERLGGMNH